VNVDFKGPADLVDICLWFMVCDLRFVNYGLWFTVQEALHQEASAFTPGAETSKKKTCPLDITCMHARYVMKLDPPTASDLIF